MHTFEIRTESHNQFVDITQLVKSKVTESGLEQGVVVIYVPHTTAGVLINEGADPAVVHDVQQDLERLVSWEQPYYRHREGNSSSHTRASLVGSSETVIVERGQLKLGTWQAIFFCEFDGPRRRQVWVRGLPG